MAQNSTMTVINPWLVEICGITPATAWDQRHVARYQPEYPGPVVGNLPFAKCGGWELFLLHVGILQKWNDSAHMCWRCKTSGLPHGLNFHGLQHGSGMEDDAPHTRVVLCRVGSSWTRDACNFHEHPWPSVGVRDG